MKRRIHDMIYADAHRAFGHRLRLARNLAGLTQTELGTALGVAFQQVQKYESGANAIAAARLALAAKALNQPLTWFFAAPTPDDAASTDDREALRIAASITRLPEPQRTSAVRLLEAIIATAGSSPLALAGE